LCEELVSEGLMKNCGSLGEMSGGMDVFIVTSRGKELAKFGI